jgi:hypothetical protein
MKKRKKNENRKFKQVYYLFVQVGNNVALKLKLVGNWNCPESKKVGNSNCPELGNKIALI